MDSLIHFLETQECESTSSIKKQEEEHVNSMIQRAIQLGCALAYTLHGDTTHLVHSFQIDPKTDHHHQLTKRLNVGFINPRDWSDVKPNHVQHDIIKLNNIDATSSTIGLTPIQSVWTKYCMVAYVAHMCAFLPLSLLPTYFQTKLGLLTKPESEHQALQVGQKCAQTLLQLIPFMNVGECI